MLFLWNPARRRSRRTRTACRARFRSDRRSRSDHLAWHGIGRPLGSPLGTLDRAHLVTLDRAIDRRAVLSLGTLGTVLCDPLGRWPVTGETIPLLPLPVLSILTLALGAILIGPLLATTILSTTILEVAILIRPILSAIWPTILAPVLPAALVIAITIALIAAALAVVVEAVVAVAAELPILSLETLALAWVLITAAALAVAIPIPAALLLLTILPVLTMLTLALVPLPALMALPLMALISLTGWTALAHVAGRCLVAGVVSTFIAALVVTEVVTGVTILAKPLLTGLAVHISGLLQLVAIGHDDAVVVFGVLQVVLRQHRIARRQRIARQRLVLLGDVSGGAAHFDVGPVRFRSCATADSAACDWCSGRDRDGSVVVLASLVTQAPWCLRSD